jgi:hypothetical protein
MPVATDKIGVMELTVVIELAATSIWGVEADLEGSQGATGCGCTPRTQCCCHSATQASYKWCPLWALLGNPETIACTTVLVEQDPQCHSLLPYHCLDRGRTTHCVGCDPWTKEDHLLPYHLYSHIGINAIVVSRRAICAFMATHPNAHTLPTQRTHRAQRRLRVILGMSSTAFLHISS